MAVLANVEEAPPAHVDKLKVFIVGLGVQQVPAEEQRPAGKLAAQLRGEREERGRGLMLADIVDSTGVRGVGGINVGTLLRGWDEGGKRRGVGMLLKKK